MNIHFANGQRVTTEKARQIGLPIGSSTGTSPARTRDGQNYPGGRQLRRRLANLRLRKEGDQPGHKLPDSHQGSQKDYSTIPGSMN